MSEPKNPIFKKNVNVSQTHPLADFIWLAVGAILIVVSISVALHLSMQWIAPYIPFEYEQKLATGIDIETVLNEEQGSDSAASKQRLQYLQNLADNLAKAQGLDDSMPITVHWMDADMINAFASLGGHIFITKGLWENVQSENALAMVMAHEIAHVKHRDPLKALGSGVLLSLFMALISGSEGGMSLVGSGGFLTSMHFSRSMETEADITAIETLFNHYGHVAGATDFFETILEEDGGNSHLEFFQTHPITTDRIERLMQIQKNNGWELHESQALPAF